MLKSSETFVTFDEWFPGWKQTAKTPFGSEMAPQVDAALLDSDAEHGGGLDGVAGCTQVL